METQCILQSGQTTVVVTGSIDDDLETVVQAAHTEFQWLRQKERAKIFAEHR